MRDSFVQALRKFVENGHVQEKLEPDYLIGELKNRGVISQFEADNVMAKSSRLQRQKELLLDLIANRDEHAFKTLLDVMDVEHFHWAREMLEHMIEKEEVKGHKKQSQD